MSVINLKPKKFNIHSYGLQSKLSRRTGICAPIVNYIWTGKRRATVDQAKKLEEAFLFYGIDITRFDLLYEVKTGESLLDFYRRKFNKD